MVDDSAGEARLIRPDMAFSNLNTWWRLSQAGRQEEFHRAFEAAYAQYLKGLGKDHAQWIGGQAVPSKGAWATKTSPTDTKLVVGRFPPGTGQGGRGAGAAAEAGGGRRGGRGRGPPRRGRLPPVGVRSPGRSGPRSWIAPPTSWCGASTNSAR